MRKDKRYMMIVTEEDERYDGKTVQINFYSENPFEGKLSDIVYGNNVKELRISSDGHDNEGLFYVLYATENGDKVGYGIVDFDAIAEEIEEYENDHNNMEEKTKKYRVTIVCSDVYTIEAASSAEAEFVARDKFGNNYLIDRVFVEENNERFNHTETSN